MRRRDFLKTIPLAAVGAGVAGKGTKAQVATVKKPVITIAHITDAHVKPELNVPERFKNCLKAVISHKIEFILNSGDSIFAADYKDITRERVTEQWVAWDECMKHLDGYEVHSCIGNHDPWWAAPSKEDKMYGIDYAVQRLGMPARYYAFKKKNWHFIILDGNNPGISVDHEQMEWLKKTLSEVPLNEHALIMSHYPILTVTSSFLGGGQYKDYKELKKLFYQSGKKIKVCLSGHQHLLDNCVYNGITYLCNGAMSGYWWGKGDEHSAGPYYLQETPPGYAIIKLYEDGTIENTYYPHTY